MSLYLGQANVLTTATAPSPPTSLIASPGNAQVNISWTEAADGGSSLTGKKVRHRVSPAGAWTESSVLPANTTNYTVTGLVNSTAYDFSVQAINAIGASAWSSNVTSTPVSSARIWWARPTRTIYTPTGGGVTRTVAGTGDQATNNAALYAALSASGPGDVINLGTGEYGTFRWESNHPDGTAGNPITIQAAAGATPIFTGTGTLNNTDTFRVRNTSYWRVSGIKVTGSQFNVRLFAASYGEFLHSEIYGSGHANFGIQWTSPNPCHHILIEGCDVHDSGTALTIGQPYGEGFYLGTFFNDGTQVWNDRTNNIEIRWCDIYNCRGDSVDIKQGCSSIYVHHNRIHDSDIYQGSVVQHTANNISQITDPITTEKVIEVHHNRAWNMDFGNPAYSDSAYFTTSCVGGEDFWNNLVWSFNLKGTETKAFNIRGTGRVSFYPINIYNNTVWVDDSYSELWTDGALLQPHPTVVRWNNICPDGLLNTSTSSGAFVGAVPAVNSAASTAGGNSTNKDEGKNFVPLNATSVSATTSSTPTDDLTSIARPQGARSDIGALEFI